MKIYLLAALLLFTFGESHAQNDTYYVISNGLNVRAAESTTAKVVLTLSKCDAVVALGYRSAQTYVNGKYGSWIQVRAKGKMGYVFDANVSELMHPDCLGNSKPSTSNIVLRPLKAIAKGRILTIYNANTEVRNIALRNAEVIRYLKKGTQVIFLEDTEIASDYDDATNCRYIRVKYLNDYVGFISSVDFVERALLED
jgi:hypothetical protein